MTDPDLSEIRFAASGMAWKGEESDGMVGISGGDIKWAQWLRVARNYQLRVGLKDRSRKTFDGFTREVRKRLHPCILGLTFFRITIKSHNSSNNTSVSRLRPRRYRSRGGTGASRTSRVSRYTMSRATLPDVLKKARNSHSLSRTRLPSSYHSHKSPTQTLRVAQKCPSNSCHLRGVVARSQKMLPMR